jgi:recombinational DNA repair protein (RecF pathway)
MAHHIYQTECFVIGSRPSGDTSRIYYLLTPSLGLISAKAQAIREIRSKLRYHLVSYSFAYVSLVRGKETWRLIGAESGQPRYSDYRSFAERRVVVRIAKFLYSMIHGEEADQNLYSLISEAIKFIANNELDNKELNNLEVLIILRSLRLFGYQKEIPELERFVDGKELSKAVINQFDSYRKLAISELNTYFANN